MLIIKICYVRNVKNIHLKLVHENLPSEKTIPACKVTSLAAGRPVFMRPGPMKNEYIRKIIRKISRKRTHFYEEQK